jgi:P-type E1-E2 ATPase
MCLYVQAADFAFGQFRFLVRLLLVHGRYSYLRCREVVLYAFYKNAAYVSCYIFYSAYTGEGDKAGARYSVEG